jgi:hypothetical protein
MLLRNYDNIMTAKKRLALYGATLSTGTEFFGDGHINVKNTSGTIRALVATGVWYYNPLTIFSEYDIAATSPHNGNSNLIAGGYSASLAGTDEEPIIAPVTYDDYKLSSWFTTSQVAYVSNTHKVVSAVYNSDESTWTYTYQRTFNAKEDIILREIGIVSSFYYRDS